MIKIKYNSNAWQKNDERDFSWCGEYCLLYLTHYILLDQPFKYASLYLPSDDPIIENIVEYQEEGEYPFI